MIQNISWRGPAALRQDLLAFVHPETDADLLWRVCSLLSLRPDPDLCASLEPLLSPDMPQDFLERVAITVFRAGGTLSEARAEQLRDVIDPTSYVWHKLRRQNRPRDAKPPLTSLEELDSILEATIALFELEEAWRADIPLVVRGTVTRQVKGGLSVESDGHRAFLPGSQIDRQPVSDREPWVGREITAHIIKINAVRGTLVLSRRAWLEAGAVEAEPHTGLAASASRRTPASLHRFARRIDGGDDWLQRVLSRTDLPPKLDAYLRMPEIRSDLDPGVAWLNTLPDSDPRLPFLFKHFSAGRTAPDHIPLHRWLLRSPEPGHRYRAVEELHRLGADILHEDAHPLVRLRILGVAADRGDPSALTALQDAAWDDDPWHEAWIWRDRTCSLEETRAQLDLDAPDGPQQWFRLHHAGRWGEALGDEAWWTQVLRRFLEGRQPFWCLLKGAVVGREPWRDAPLAEERLPVDTSRLY